MWRSWVLWVYCAAIVGWMGAGRGSWGAGPLNISDQGVNSEREQTFGKMRKNQNVGMKLIVLVTMIILIAIIEGIP